MKYYCHRFEDKIIDDLLHHKQQGFYVDVGAHSPVHESVTKVFYDRGWSGVNIEPQPNRHLELITQRPRDRNLQIAIGKEVGTLVLHLNDGLTTAVSDYSLKEWPILEVPMTTLTRVCDEFVPTHIDFLKIDVEGLELEVILGMDFNKYRPTVLCVECTKPNTTIPTYEEWDKVLVQNGYEFVTDNVYNRFYKDIK